MQKEHIHIFVVLINRTKWYNASGWTVYVYNKCSAKSKALALSLFDVAEEKDLFGNRRIPATKYHMANFCVLRETICPAILTENLFQDNKKDVEYLLSDEGKKNICPNILCRSTNIVQVTTKTKFFL